MWDQGGLRALAAIGAGNDLKTDGQINRQTSGQTNRQVDKNFMFKKAKIFYWLSN